MANANAAAWHVSTAGVVRPPRLIIANSSGTELAGINADNWTASVIGGETTQVLRVAYELAASASLKLRWRWQYQEEGVSLGVAPYCWLRFIQLHMGIDSSLSFVEGSEATKLFYDGQIVLAAHAQWPALYTATNIEFADAAGIDPDSQALEMGSTIRIRSTSMGIANTLVRVVGVRFDPRDPRVKVLMLGTAPEYFTDQVGRISTKRQRVDISIDIDAGGEVRKTTLASTEPPVDVPGSNRFDVPDGTIATGAVDVIPLP
jgi:hypothetical protein